MIQNNLGQSVIVRPDRNQRMSQQGFDLRSKEEGLSSPAIVKRPETYGIPREQELAAIGIEKSERKVPRQFLRHAVAKGVIRCLNKCRVGRGGGNSLIRRNNS